MVGLGYIVLAGFALIALGIFLFTREKRVKAIPEIIMIIGVTAISMIIY